MLRGATRGAGADGMNTMGNFIGGCWTSDANWPMTEAAYTRSAMNF
jgi:hypothetical protein